MYMNEIFTIAEHSRFNTRSNAGTNLVQPHRYKSSGQKAISFLGPKVWNSLPQDINKSVTKVNTFKHKIKELYFKHISKMENDTFLYFYMYILLANTRHLDETLKLIIYVFMFSCLINVWIILKI